MLLQRLRNQVCKREHENTLHRGAVLAEWPRQNRKGAHLPKATLTGPLSRSHLLGQQSNSRRQGGRAAYLCCSTWGKGDSRTASVIFFVDYVKWSRAAGAPAGGKAVRHFQTERPHARATARCARRRRHLPEYDTPVTLPCDQRRGLQAGAAGTAGRDPELPGRWSPGRS